MVAIPLAITITQNEQSLAVKVVIQNPALGKSERLPPTPIWSGNKCQHSAYHRKRKYRSAVNPAAYLETLHRTIQELEARNCWRQSYTPRRRRIRPHPSRASQDHSRSQRNRYFANRPLNGRCAASPHSVLSWITRHAHTSIPSTPNHTRVPTLAYTSSDTCVVFLLFCQKECVFRLKHTMSANASVQRPKWCDWNVVVRPARESDVLPAIPRRQEPQSQQVREQSKSGLGFRRWETRNRQCSNTYCPQLCPQSGRR